MIEQSQKMRRICSIIRILSIICLVFFAAIYIAFIAICLFTTEASQARGPILYAIVHATMVCTVFIIAILGLNDVRNGMSPFTAKQVRRLVVAGFIFLGIALAEFLMPLGMTFDLMPTSQALVTVDATTEGTSNLDVSALLFSFASFCLSAIFKYGIILQQLSDETV